MDGPAALRRGSAADLAPPSAGVLPGNEAAIRLYRRHGYRPTWTYLSRFAGRRP